MKLIKCKKCGASIMTSETLLSDMQAEYDELVKKSHKVKGASLDVIKQQLKHLNKMMVQICHSSTEAEIRKSNAYNELAMLKKYLIHNQLISYEVLEKIQNDAREMTKQKIAEDEKHIANIYGDFISELANRTKSDPTSKKQLKTLQKKGNDNMRIFLGILALCFYANLLNEKDKEKACFYTNALMADIAALAAITIITLVK